MAAPCCNTVPLRLLLVRHGLSISIRSAVQGRDDLSNLTEEGHEQARALGESLADVALDAVYSSRLRRAASTTASHWTPVVARHRNRCSATACWRWI